MYWSKFSRSAACWPGEVAKCADWMCAQIGPSTSEETQPAEPVLLGMDIGGRYVEVLGAEVVGFVVVGAGDLRGHVRTDRAVVGVRARGGAVLLQPLAGAPQ